MPDFAANPLLDSHPDLAGLAVALLLGLLIGIQRGWSQRERSAGERVAGIRTYTLTGLLGGLSMLLARTTGEWLLAVVLLCLTIVAVNGYRLRAAQDQNVSITGAISLLLTFTFGALAMQGYVALAAGSAVVTAIILDNKAEIHRLLTLLEEKELDAALKLLLISVVMLPNLPNQGFGPGGVLNPYEIWWMVVLIASISFVGHFAMRIGGARKGILFTGLFAGLSSSTALTLHYARLSREMPELTPLLATGIMLAWGTMFPRILLVSAIIHPPLAWLLGPPLLVAVVILYGLSWRQWRKHTNLADGNDFSPHQRHNPLDLKAALLMGMVLTLVLVLAELLRSWLGDTGIYLLAAATGITDVDPITLSFARMAGTGSESELGLQVATYGILIAAVVNSLVKAGMASVIGEGLGRYLVVPLGLAVVGAVVTAWLMN